ncbi:MAG: hypothetical protein AAF616_04355 [Bacteroidota bacterium]
MEIPFLEIWNFLELVKPDEGSYQFSLQVGKIEVNEISPDVLLLLQKDPGFDTELLPSIFTFREILWQPNVFKNPKDAISPLSIFRAFCNETAERNEPKKSQAARIYTELIKGMGRNTELAIQSLQKDRPNVNRVLRDLRIKNIPSIKFFMHHPQNRYDYFRDAQHRLDYAVKVMLGEFQTKYSELLNPYWTVQRVSELKTPKLSQKPSEQS